MFLKTGGVISMEQFNNKKLIVFFSILRRFFPQIPLKKELCVKKTENL
jgi:hypothetical protein